MSVISGLLAVAVSLFAFTFANAAQAPGGGGGGNPSNTTSSGFVVKDSLNQVLGKSDGWGVIRTVGTDQLYFHVSPAGFNRTGYTFYYTSTDCTGTGYIYSWRDSNPTWGNFAEGVFSADGQLGYFAAFPAEDINVRSTLWVRDDIVQGCSSGYDYIGRYGVATPIDLSALGFVPPFRLE